MGQRVKCNALVLAESDYGESNKMLTALTDRFGKISVSAKGAKKPSCPFIASAQVFCYSSMELSEGRNGIYTLCECELINSFYSLRENIDVLFLAYEIAKTVLTVSQEQFPDENLLRLCLNTFYSLANVPSKEPEKALLRMNIIRSVFYIRLAFDQGFFDFPDHFKHQTTEKAAFHITRSDFKELFAFSLPDDSLKELSSIAERAKTAVLE